jgi:hypothetical protein
MVRESGRRYQFGRRAQRYPRPWHPVGGYYMPSSRPISKLRPPPTGPAPGSSGHEPSVAAGGAPSAAAEAVARTQRWIEPHAAPIDAHPRFSPSVDEVSTGQLALIVLRRVRGRVVADLRGLRRR